LLGIGGYLWLKNSQANAANVTAPATDTGAAPSESLQINASGGGTQVTDASAVSGAIATPSMLGPPTPSPSYTPILLGPPTAAPPDNSTTTGAIPIPSPVTRKPPTPSPSPVTYKGPRA